MCAMALAPVLSRDPKSVFSCGSKEQGCEISAGSGAGNGKPWLQRSILVGYPTVSAAVGLRAQEQSKLFSSNEYRVLPAYALIGLNSLAWPWQGCTYPGAGESRLILLMLPCEECGSVGTLAGVVGLNPALKHTAFVWQQLNAPCAQI